MTNIASKTNVRARLIIVAKEGYLSSHDRAHNNELVRHFVNHRASDEVSSVLALLEAFDSLAMRPCFYSVQHVLKPLSEAISNALSLDIGRLNGGRLSRFHNEILDNLEEAGFEMDR
jgi:hypothetical protein